MTNHLNKLRKELRSFAKRNKNFKYTEMSLFVFLMTRMLTFTQQTVLTKDIETKKQEINTSFDDIYKELKKTKAENNKLMKNYNLELIQLMEQGDHVVKSPWSSWQHGANYFYNDWNGTYKGRGDKEEKYPYLGTYTRSNNLFMRTISPNSKNFLRFMERNMTSELDRLSKLGINDTSLSAASSVRGDFNPSFGLESSVFDQEPVSSLTLLATVKPKQVNKEPVKVDLGTIEGPGDMNFDITPPSISIMEPKIVDLNFGHISAHKVEKNSHSDNTMKASKFSDYLRDYRTSGTYSNNYLSTSNAGNTFNGVTVNASNLTWINENDVPGKIDSVAQLKYSEKPTTIKNGSADNWFKIYFDSDGGNTDIGASFVIDNVRGSINDVANNTTAGTPAPGLPTFLSGVSRGASLDGAGTLNLSSGNTINLAGPFVVGLEQQTGSGTREIKNSGTITDEVERTHYRGGEGLGNLHTAILYNGSYYAPEDVVGRPTYTGPTDSRLQASVNNIDNGLATIYRSYDSGIVYKDGNDDKIRSNYDGGYTGYKVGLMLIEEDAHSTGDIAKLTNAGTITFNGGNSTGMLVNASAANATKVEVINNSGATINMNGGSSTGMKIASLITNDSKMQNDGEIYIRGGSSNGMSVINTRAYTNIVLNSSSGKIYVSPESGSSTGMILVTNNSDDIKNQGLIQVTGKNNTGMWVEGSSNPIAYNTSSAKINVGGTSNNIGMLADNGGVAKNQSGSITLSGTQNAGMMAYKTTTMGKVENTANIVSTGNNNNKLVGIQVNEGAEGYNGTTSASGTITLSGSNTTGVRNEKGTFKMDNTGSVISVNGSGSIAVYASGSSSVTEINNGTVTIEGSSTNPLNAVGLYVADGSKIKITGGTGNRLVANSGALLFYNYANNNSTSTGTFELSGSDVNAQVNSGGLAFHLRGGTTPISTIANINSALDNMFNLTSSSTKLNVNLASGASLFEIKNDGLAAAANTVKTSELGSSSLSFGSGNKITVSGADNAKLLKIRGGSLEVDSSVNLDTSNNILNRVEFESSNVKVTNSITGTSAMAPDSNGERYGIRQKDTLSSSSTPILTVENIGNISLTGDKSRAVVVEFGKVINGGSSAGTITVGEEGIGIYGADNSVIENKSNGTINIGSKGVGIIGANNLTTSPNSSQKINITNEGKIEATDSAGEKTIGIYADNTNTSLTPSTDSVIDNKSTGTIDLSKSKGSLGIFVGRTLLKSDGTVTVGDESAGIKGKDALIEISNANAAINIGKKSIGVILENFGKGTSPVGYFDGQNGKISVNGTGSVVYYVDNSELDSGTSGTKHFNDNLSIVDNGNPYTYIFAKNSSVLNYDSSLTSAGTAPKQIQTDKSVFINAKDSTVNLGIGNKIESSKNEVIATYSNNGTATNKGTITLNGNKSVALYGENGGALVNEKDISVNTNSVGIYNKDTITATNKGTNSKIILLGDYGIGMRSDTATGDSLNEGKIESSKLRAIGISASSGSNSLTNKGEINFTGQQSIGMHTDVKGTSGHVILNDTGAKITLVDSADPSEANIGIYSEHSKDNAVNNGTIEAGHQTVGILSKSGGNVGLGGNSTTKVGDNAVAVFSNGGNIDIANGAKIIIGKEIGNNLNKESVGVYYAGSNGTITNNTSDITIGDGSYGFVIKGGLNNTLNSNNPSNGTVNLTTDAVYIYSEDNKGKVNNATDLKSSISGEINYGIYTNGGGTNSGNLDFNKGKGNVGIYSYFKDPNYKNNVNSKGEYIASTNYVPEKFTNTGIINVSASDLTNANDQKFGIGMAAGYVESRTVYNSVTGKSEIKRDVLGYGNIENTGTINVTTPNSIGMYAGGAGSVATNRGNINLSGPELNVGMFLEDGAVGHNYGNITVNSNEGVGIAVLRGAEIVNHPGSTITVNGTDGIGIAVAGGIIRNYGNFGIVKKEETIDGAVIKAPGDGAVAIKRVIANGDKQMGYTDDGRNWNITRNDLVSVEIPEGTYDATITLNGVEQTPIEVFSVENRKRTEIPTSSVGIYMDTSGVNVTRPVTNLGSLSSVGIKSVDLIIGTEATNYTTEKYLKLSDEMIAPYNDMILEAQRQGLRKWEIYSGSLTWMATAAQNKNTQLMENVYLVKVPYTVWAGKTGTPKEATDTYNFLDGLEQRYGVEKEGRERELFKKLNGIGNNEHILLVQAFDEMMGHQYGNEQMRISSTGNVIDKEVNYLMKDWNNPSKQANKIKVFGMKDEFKTDTAGIIDYTNNAYGIAYVHEDEAIKLGNSKGWYAGIVNNRFKLKDIGKSKEEQNMLKIGIFKKMSPSKDYNGKLTWTISGEGFVGLNNMERRYLVVDDIFHAKSDFYTYGIGLKNEIGYDIRTSERTSIRPYAALDMEYGRFSDIKEDRGEIRLEVNSNDYYSIKPELGVEFKYKQPLAVRTTFTASLGAAYENELGKVGDVDNKARVRYTNANWFNIRGEKDDRKGNGKFDLKLGIENTRFGVTVNAGYDTKGENVRGGIGFRAIY